MYGEPFSNLNYWRLADELSVVDATFLTLNVDPGHFRLESLGDPSQSRIFQIGNYSEDPFDRQQTEDNELVIDASQFRAVFKAIRSAVLSNKVRAKITNWARHPTYSFYGDDHTMDPKSPDEDERHYGFALSRGLPTVYSNSDSILSTGGESAQDRMLYILKEPDWNLTMVDIDELKRWYSSRNYPSSFFFPKGISSGFKDKNHPRYSAKLATAVEAWEAVVKPAKNKSPKASLFDWIVSNGVRFGLGSDEGVVSKTAAEEVAKIANWQTSGGATRTYDEDTLGTDEASKPIQNFEKVEPDLGRYQGNTGAASRDLDDDLPF